MSQMLNQSLSDMLKGWCQNGDFEKFISTYQEYQLNPSAFLYARYRKQAFPLIKRAIQPEFTQENTLGKLEIATFLIEEGANTHVSAPDGRNLLHTLLTAYRNTYHSRAGRLLEFALKLFDKVEIDVALVDDELGYVLDEAIWARKKSNLIPEQAELSLTIIEKLLAKGAKFNREEINAQKYPDLFELIEKYKLKEDIKQVPLPLETPAFADFLEGEMLVWAEALWNENTDQKKSLLEAIKVLQDRAYLHANWGYGKTEIDAITLLKNFAANLPKESKKEVSKFITKLSKADKPCYDEQLYQSFYKAVLSSDS